MGHRDEAGMRIDELSRIVQAVADLIASAKIVDDASTSPNPNGPMTITSTAFLPPDYPPPGSDSMEFDHAVDPGDSSRKRSSCASSMAAGERMIKAPKLEPQDDLPLHMAPPLGSAGPHGGFFSALLPDAKPGSLPPSAPGSRPPSSSGLMMQMSSSANLIAPPLTIPNTPVDMNGNLVSHIPSAPYSSPPISTAGWNEGRPPFSSRSHHQHSLSGGSMHQISNLAALQDPSYSMPSGFNPTLPSNPLIPTGMSAGMSLSPPRQQLPGRPSRSSSLSNLYMTPSYPVPSSGISAPHSPIVSSPEDDDAEESDGEDYPHSPPLTMIIKNGTIKKANGDSGSLVRPKASRRTSTADANEIPQEFRADVDRIFFEFLDSTCSNREPSPH